MLMLGIETLKTQKIETLKMSSPCVDIERFHAAYMAHCETLTDMWRVLDDACPLPRVLTSIVAEYEQTSCVEAEATFADAEAAFDTANPYPEHMYTRGTPRRLHMNTHTYYSLKGRADVRRATLLPYRIPLVNAHRRDLLRKRRWTTKSVQFILYRMGFRTAATHVRVEQDVHPANPRWNTHVIRFGTPAGRWQVDVASVPSKYTEAVVRVIRELLREDAHRKRK
jgi:hypothetical protein